MLHTYHTYDTLIPGPRLLVLGSIHGDEVCGSLGIANIISRIHTGDITLVCGSVTFVPYANSIAYSQNKRYIEYNLNRIFADTHTQSNEHTLATAIKKHIDVTDFVLDLHSFSRGLDPFVFDDFGTIETKKIIKNLPVDHAMTGWTDLYVDDSSMDTIGYAKSIGKYGITIECGSHTNKNSIYTAEKSILSVLGSLGIIIYKQEENIHQKYIHVSRKICRKDNDIFSKKWENFDTVSFGETIIDSPTGNIVAPTDGYIIMPNENARVGDEWAYFGKVG